MKNVKPHSVGSVLYQVEAVSRVNFAQDPFNGAGPCRSVLHYAQVWRILLSYREHPRGPLEYRAAHFLSVPRVGVLPHAGPQEDRRDLRVGDSLVMEGAAERLTFSEHGDSSNAYYPLEFDRSQLLDPFQRKES